MDNLLHISWCDSMWVPNLNSANVMDYFSERSNPFYSRDCNNEFIKMQQNTRADQLQHMQGTEYILLHAQENILYIIKKQHRFSPTQTNPLACYHIIAGQVFQTPDLGSVINSRLVSTINHLNGAFSELQSFSHYHPSKGYWWQTSKLQDPLEQQKKDKEKKSSKKEEAASIFQRRRVDLLLEDLANRFPYKPTPLPTQPPTSVQQQPTSQPSQQPSEMTIKTEDIKMEIKTEVKQEPKTDMKPENKTEPKTDMNKPDMKHNVFKVDIKQEKPDVKIENSPVPSNQRIPGKPPPEKRQRI